MKKIRTDEAFMEECIAQGLLAKEHKHYPVGSIIVKDGEIIATGYEGEAFVTASVNHSEIVAVLKAMEVLNAKDLSDCILYSTKEPCFMCSYLIRQSKIKGVVYAESAGDIGGASSNYPILTANDIANWGNPPFVIEGILEEKCKQVLTSF